VEFTVGRTTGKQVTGRMPRAAAVFALPHNFGNTTCYPNEQPITFRMKRILLALLLPGTLMIISFGSAQTPDANQEQKLLALVKVVQTQQAQIAGNQEKIDEKLTGLGETIRTARIFAERVGGKHKP